MNTIFLSFVLFCLHLSTSRDALLYSMEVKRMFHYPASRKGAEVYLNGIKQGKTPTTLRLQKGNEYDIEFKLDGYESKTWRLGYSLGAGWLILDILAGLVGVIVDAATGDWNGFDNNKYKAVLEKK